MHRNKFIVTFVGCYCVMMSVNGYPISFENKLDCGNKCKTDEAARLQINDRQWNVQQADELNLDRQLPTATGRVIPNREKRQTNNVPSNVTNSSPETTLDAVKSDTQIDSATQPPLLRKDASDFTTSAEYQKAQENLLSASEKVKLKDIQVAPDGDTVSAGKSLPNTSFSVANIQDITENETVESIVPTNRSTGSMNSPTKPDPEKVAVTPDNNILNGSPGAAVDITQISEISESDVLIPDEDSPSKPGISVDETRLQLNKTPTDISNSKPTVVGDADVPGDPTVIKLNAAAIGAVKGGDVDVQEKIAENKSKTVVMEPAKGKETDGDSSTLNTSGDLYHNIPNKTDSTRQDTLKKLEAEPEQIGFPKPQTDSVNSSSADTIKTIKPIETDNVSKKPKEIPVIPDSLTTPSNSSVAVKGEQHKNDKNGATQGDELSFNNKTVNHDEIYNLDNWDVEFTDTSSFNDRIEDACDCCDCGRTKSPNNFDDIAEDHSSNDDIEYTSIEEEVTDGEDSHRSDYSTNDEYFEENNDDSDDIVEYTEHTYDNSRDFSDHFDPENDLDDILTDIEFSRNDDNDCGHVNEVADEDQYFEFDDIIFH